MKKISIILFVALVGAIFSSCIVSENRIGEFTVLSTKSVPIKGDSSKRVTGESVPFVNVLGLYFKGSPNLNDAIDDALNKSGANMLLDGVISTKVVPFPPFFTSTRFIVEGTPINVTGIIETK